MVSEVRGKTFARLTDMHNVARPINHDIAIVPILDLQYVAQYRVGCHRLDESGSGRLEGRSVHFAETRAKEAEQVVHFRPTHFVSRRGIRHYVNDAHLYAKSEGSAVRK